MVKFGGFVSKKWNVSDEVAAKICEHFEKGDSVYYLCDYNPSIAAEVDISLLSDIFESLQEIKKLSPKKKRVSNAMNKAGVLTNSVKKRIELCTSSVELDDILLPYRPKSRSRGQQAIDKGLAPLADTIDEQEVEEGAVKDLAEEYIGKHSTLKSIDDVIAGVKDILVERYANDETVRSMVREVGLENGYFEILPRVKKDKRFIKYRNKMTPINEFTSEEYLTLCEAEKKKQVKLKHGVQLFHINELLRQHFITNPDSIGYDLICEIIDECWTRLLNPIVERDVKARKYKDSEDWAFREIDKELLNKINEKKISGSLLSIEMHNNKNLIIVALNEKGHLLSAAKEELKGEDKEFLSNRVRQFFSRYKPKHIIISDNEVADSAISIVNRSLKSISGEINVERFKAGDTIVKLAHSKWMQERCAVLEDDMKNVYALGLAFLQPLSIISQLGIQYFSINPLQKYIDNDRLGKLLKLRITEMELHKGIPFIDVPESVLKNIKCVTKEVLVTIRKEGIKKPFASKNDFVKVEGMTKLIFRTIAGYIIIPNAKDIIDRTLIHPEHYEWLNEISLELNASFDSLVNDPDRLRGVACENFAKKAFIDQKLPEQLRVGQKHPLLLKGSKHRRKHRLSELKEGSIISGRVTNITKFGVFVDINAVCDGLIHISQLADGYVETADQVVKLDDPVDVRILKIDKKKRRVSLSMKKLGTKAPKISPSRGQLSNLADYFKNR